MGFRVVGYVVRLTDGQRGVDGDVGFGAQVVPDPPDPQGLDAGDAAKLEADRRDRLLGACWWCRSSSRGTR